jgi:hypothetical protein
VGTHGAAGRTDEIRAVRRVFTASRTDRCDDASSFGARDVLRRDRHERE